MLAYSTSVARVDDLMKGDGLETGSAVVATVGLLGGLLPSFVS